jgi:hypothetical protein
MPHAKADSPESNSIGDIITGKTEATASAPHSRVTTIGSIGRVFTPRTLSRVPRARIPA